MIYGSHKLLLSLAVAFAAAAAGGYLYYIQGSSIFLGIAHISSADAATAAYRLHDYLPSSARTLRSAPSRVIGVLQPPRH